LFKPAALLFRKLHEVKINNTRIVLILLALASCTQQYNKTETLKQEFHIPVIAKGL